VKVTATPIEQSQIVLEIEVDQDQVDRALDQAYRRSANRVKVPGFRPGKAPRHLVERMIGTEALLDDAVQQLVPQVFQDALEEQQLVPSARPRLEVVSIDPLQVKATVPVQPEVKLGEYRALRVPRPEVNITDEQVNDVLDRLRQANAEWAPVERPAQAADLVGIDVVVKDGDEEVITANDAEFIVDPEGANPVPEFSQHLVNQAAGSEVSYTVTVPEDDQSERLRGKSVDVTTKVNWVKEKQLPELDDAFAATVGEYETLDALKDEIRTDLQTREGDAAKTGHQEEVIKSVVDAAEMEIPPQMIEERADELFHELERALGAQGIPIQQYMNVASESEESFRSDLLERGERSVRRALVLDAVAKSEAIEIPDSDIRAELEQAVANDKNGEKLVEQAMQREDTRERIAAVLRERQAIAFLVDIATGGDGKVADEPAAEPVTVDGEPES